MSKYTTRGEYIRLDCELRDEVDDIISELVVTIKKTIVYQQQERVITHDDLVDLGKHLMEIGESEETYDHRMKRYCPARTTQTIEPLASR